MDLTVRTLRKTGKNRNARVVAEGPRRTAKPTKTPKEVVISKIRTVLVKEYQMTPEDAERYSNTLLDHDNLTIMSPDIWAALFALMSMRPGEDLSDEDFTPGELAGYTDRIVNTTGFEPKMLEISRIKTCTSLYRYYRFWKNKPEAYRVVR